MKTLRTGRERPARGVGGAAGVDVGEVAGPGPEGRQPTLPAAPVLLGTEAVLHRVAPGCGAVAFLDIDLHLLAPRLSAVEETLALFVRAGRLVGGRGTGAPGLASRRRPGCPTTPCSRRWPWAGPTTVLDEESRPPRVGSATLLGAGRGVGRPRPATPRLCAGRGRRRARGPPGRSVVADGRGPLPAAAPTATSRCATCWPARPAGRARAACRGRPGHALTAGGARPGRPGRRAAGKMELAEPHHPPVRRPRAQGAHREVEDIDGAGGEPGRVHDRDHVRRAGVRAWPPTRSGCSAASSSTTWGTGLGRSSTHASSRATASGPTTRVACRCPGLSWDDRAAQRGAPGRPRPRRQRALHRGLRARGPGVPARARPPRRHPAGGAPQRGPAQGGAQDPAQPHVDLPAPTRTGWPTSSPADAGRGPVIVVAQTPPALR